MITLQTFMLGLLIVSTFTALATEALKKALTEHNKEYRANTLAGIVSVVLSLGVGIAYFTIKGIDFTSAYTIYLVALIFMSWLCSMVGYDKVVQAISQFKTTTNQEVTSDENSK